MVTDPTDLRRLAADDELDAICGKLLLDTSYEGYAGRKAAHATIALRKRVAELEGALRPFAAMADRLDRDAGGPFPDTLPLGCDFQVIGLRPHVGDLRRARAALGGSQ
jgi:hypothetical protein